MSSVKKNPPAGKAPKKPSTTAAAAAVATTTATTTTTNVDAEGHLPAGEIVGSIKNGAVNNHGEQTSGDFGMTIDGEPVRVFTSFDHHYRMAMTFYYNFTQYEVAIVQGEKNIESLFRDYCAYFDVPDLACGTKGQLQTPAQIRNFSVRVAHDIISCMDALYKVNKKSLADYARVYPARIRTSAGISTKGLYDVWIHTKACQIIASKNFVHPSAHRLLPTIAWKPSSELTSKPLLPMRAIGQ